MASTGTYPNYAQALELIGQNLKNASASDADRRVEAIVQASFPTVASRDKALETLSRLAERANALSPDDRIVMARLYLSRGEWVRSSQIFREVVGKSKDPRHLSAYVDALLGQKELSAAEDWQGRLEALAPRDFGTVDLRARLLAVQGRYPEAFDHIVAALERRAGRHGDRGASARAASLRLEELGDELTRLNRKAEAERFFAQAETLMRGKDGPTQCGAAVGCPSAIPCSSWARPRGAG